MEPIGIRAGSYELTDRLGRGKFARVWGDREVAIKVFLSDDIGPDYWSNEVALLNQIRELQCPNLIKYIDHFAYTEMINKRPYIFPCIVMERLQCSVHRALKYCRHKNASGFPLILVNRISNQFCNGIRALHSAGIIHTDIKLENMLLNCEIRDLMDLKFEVKLTDFGSTCTFDDHFRSCPGTMEYSSPELILEQDYDASVDVWAALCSIFELITGDPLFDFYGYHDISYDPLVDEYLVGNVESSTFEDDSDAGEDSGEDSGDNIGEDSGDDSGIAGSSNSSQSDSDEESSETVKMRENTRMLMLFEKLMGRPPKHMRQSAREYYNAKGKLKNCPPIEVISFRELLEKNYNLSEEMCNAVSDLLARGILYEPSQRCNIDTVIRSLGTIKN